MKQPLPSAQILQDLVTENWQLRWQVLEIFSRVRFDLRDHARGSRRQREHLGLGHKLAELLHSPEDRDLHLIITAAYFLGGPAFVFLVFQHLGIDDRDEFYPQLAKLKKELGNPDSGLSFSNYFEVLLSSNRAVESTTAIAAALAIRLFEPQAALTLLLSIPNPETRGHALHLLARLEPGFSGNEYLFADEEKLRRHPEAITLITPPLETAQKALCLSLAEDLIAAGREETITVALNAIGRLQLQEALFLVEQSGRKDLSTTAIRSALGDTQACRQLLDKARSWRQRTRCQALAGLAHCATSEALEVLRKCARKKDPEERTAALKALGNNPHPEAFSILLSQLQKSRETGDRRRLLTLLARHPRAGHDPRIADFLADWHDQAELCQELLECLEVFGYGPKWAAVVTNFTLPLTAPHRQEIALFMTRHANFPQVRKALIRLLFDLDWTFTFRLLQRLRPVLGGRDIKILVRLLQNFEEGSALSISELLTKVSDVPRFDDALCLFLNQKPDLAAKLLTRFINQLMSGDLPKPDSLIARFNLEDAELRKLVLAVDDLNNIRLETRLPLLYFQALLREFDLPGGHALAMVVHRTRRYSGYFRVTLCEILETIINEDRQLHQSEALPVLHELLDFIRRRPGYDHLRKTLLEQIAAIKRRARDLRVCQKVTQDRDLRIIQVKKALHRSPKTPDTKPSRNSIHQR